MKKQGMILIVDDTEMNRSLLADMLSEDYEILEAANGVEAAAILHQRSEELSLVLLDIVMPEMDGLRGPGAHEQERLDRAHPRHHHLVGDRVHLHRPRL